MNRRDFCRRCIASGVAVVLAPLVSYPAPSTELVNQQYGLPTTKADWIDLDEQVRRVAGYRLAAWTELKILGSYGIHIRSETRDANDLSLLPAGDR